MSVRRGSLPGAFGLTAVVIVNGFASVIVLSVVFRLLGISHILSNRSESVPILHGAANWDLVWPMIPGAAAAYALLWFWLILVGRVRGVSWPTAAFYGVFIALADVPLSGLISGIEHGNPLLGLLLGLIALLLVPTIWLAMFTAGVILGSFNAHLAYRWIEAHRLQ